MNCKLIEDFLNGTYITERTIERSTLEFYLSKARSFGRFLGRDARLDDLQSGSVNAFLTARLKHQCKSTVHGARSALVAIWNYAVEAGELERSPERIKPIKRDDTIVEGWDTQQQLTLAISIKPYFFAEFRRLRMRRVKNFLLPYERHAFCAL